MLTRFFFSLSHLTSMRRCIRCRVERREELFLNQFLYFSPIYAFTCIPCLYNYYRVTISGRMLTVEQAARQFTKFTEALRTTSMISTIDSREYNKKILVQIAVPCPVSVGDRQGFKEWCNEVTDQYFRFYNFVSHGIKRCRDSDKLNVAFRCSCRLQMEYNKKISDRETAGMSPEEAASHHFQTRTTHRSECQVDSNFNCEGLLSYTQEPNGMVIIRHQHRNHKYVPGSILSKIIRATTEKQPCKSTMVSKT